MYFSGTILNIESQEMKFHEWGVGVDPDESCWVESVKFNLSFLVVIRVFYELGPPACEEIGKVTSTNLSLCRKTMYMSGFYGIDVKVCLLRKAAVKVDAER